METRRRPRVSSLAAFLATALFLLAGHGQAAGQRLPSTTISVKLDDAWTEFWRADRAPVRWAGPHPALAAAIDWRVIDDGIEHAEVSLAGDGLAWRLRLVLVRIDPRLVDLGLVESLRGGGTLGAWTIEEAPPDALLAFNAGQFHGGRPWGWVVRDGREIQPPGTGALGMAFVVDSAGAARLVPPDAIATVRTTAGVRSAFQSYPMLLVGEGLVPEQLRNPGRGVDVDHRDSRFALGQLPDSRLLLAMTRFEGLGGKLSSLPVGPTTPEMAGIMGALGCVSAMSLDGGLSGQLLLRDPSGRSLAWKGLRRVPLALVGRPRLVTAGTDGITSGPSR